MWGGGGCGVGGVWLGGSSSSSSSSSFARIYSLKFCFVLFFRKRSILLWTAMLNSSSSFLTCIHVSNNSDFWNAEKWYSLRTNSSPATEMFSKTGVKALSKIVNNEQKSQNLVYSSDHTNGFCLNHFCQSVDAISKNKIYLMLK